MTAEHADLPSLLTVSADMTAWQVLIRCGLLDEGRQVEVWVDPEGAGGVRVHLDRSCEWMDVLAAPVATSVEMMLASQWVRCICVAPDEVDPGDPSGADSAHLAGNVAYAVQSLCSTDEVMAVAGMRLSLRELTEFGPHTGPELQAVTRSVARLLEERLVEVLADPGFVSRREEELVKKRRPGVSDPDDVVWADLDGADVLAYGLAGQVSVTGAAIGSLDRAAAVGLQLPVIADASLGVAEVQAAMVLTDVRPVDDWVHAMRVASAA